MQGELKKVYSCLFFRCRGFILISTVMMVSTLYANSHVFYVLLRKKLTHNSTINVIIAHINTVDMGVAVFVMAPNIYNSYYRNLWYMGNIPCKVYKYLNCAVLYTSTFLTMLIALDRLLAIRLPLRSQLRRHTMTRSLIASWVCGFVFAAPQVSKKSDFHETSYASSTQCLDSISFVNILASLPISWISWVSCQNLVNVGCQYIQNYPRISSQV